MHTSRRQTNQRNKAVNHSAGLDRACLCAITLHALGMCCVGAWDVLAQIVLSSSLFKSDLPCCPSIHSNGCFIECFISFSSCWNGCCLCSNNHPSNSIANHPSKPYPMQFFFPFLVLEWIEKHNKTLSNNVSNALSWQRRNAQDCLQNIDLSDLSEISSFSQMVI